MKTYKVTFTPLEPYFFGNEKGFAYPKSKDGNQTNKSQFSNQYFIRSEALPSQSTLLGALRYHLLPKKKSNWSDYTPEDKALNNEAVGEQSFDPAYDRTFGRIKKISPVFIQQGGNILVPVPMNHIKGKTTYDPFSEYKTVITPFGDRYYTEEYNAKDGICTDYMSLAEGAIVERSVIFKTETRIGINRFAKKNGFFKKEYYTLNKGFSFGAYITLDGDSKPKDGVLFLGQGKSAFAFSFVEEENKLTEQVKKRLPEGVAYCLSDTFTEPEIYDASKFSVTDTKTYRAYSRQGGRVSKEAVLYRVISAGSVFIPADIEAFADFVRKDNVNRIGYNEIIIK
ncbi:MAG: hypothetical protein IJ298_03580 [Ruminococcus sp.]|nr:hypothetical protein [Ruminococcus sp.]